MQRWLWAVLIFFFLLFSLVPTFYEISRAADLHPQRYFELVHNYYTDYNFYLSRIRQGREGAWTVTEKYTSEPHSGSYIQIMYLYMGKVSAWIGVPWQNSGDTYHTARVVLAATLLFMIAFVAKKAFANVMWQMIGFCLVVTSSTWPILVYHMQEWRFGGYMPWWTIMDSLQRTTFVPHMLAGQALIIFLLIAFSDEHTMARPGNWVFLGLLAFLLGIVFPPGLLFVFAAYGVFVVVDLLFVMPWKQKILFRQWAIVRIAGPAISAVISAPSLLYLSLALRVYPWKRLVDFAVLHPQPFVLKDYVLAVGPMLIIGGIGGIWAIWKRETKLYIFVAWVLAWAALIIAFQYIPQESPLRFTEMLPHVPLGILAAFLLGNLGKLGGLGKKIGVLAAILLIFLGLLQMYSSWRWQKEFIDQKVGATQPLVPTGSYVMYPLKDMYNAMIFIQDHTKRSDVILSETTAGNYIPVYSGNTVYVGHAATIATEQKEQIVTAFFSGVTTAAAAKDFLASNNLHYIFFGPQEVADGGIDDLTVVYPFLHEIYKNTYVRVYTW